MKQSHLAFICLEKKTILLKEQNRLFPILCKGYAATISSAFAQLTLTIILFGFQKQQKKFHGQHTFSHLSPVTNPLLCMPCSNTISVQNSTRNHTIQLSSWIKLLEILCASDAHFTLDCMYVLVSVRGRETDRERER